jgi:Fe-S cluster biogenesis protein NfuA
VKDDVVSLRLQGACGICSSSTSTMNMDIERVLMEKFGRVRFNFRVDLGLRSGSA